MGEHPLAAVRRVTWRTEPQFEIRPKPGARFGDADKEVGNIARRQRPPGIFDNIVL